VSLPASNHRDVDVTALFTRFTATADFYTNPAQGNEGCGVFTHKKGASKMDLKMNIN